MPDPTPSPRQPSGLNIGLVLAGVVGGVIGGLLGFRLAQTTLTSSSSTTSSTSTRAQQVSIQESSATTSTVKKANPAVVSIIISKDFSTIYGQQQTSPFNGFFGFPLSQPQVPSGPQEIGGGSGFIVQADGLIVTNKHVVDDTQASYTVVMNDGKRYDAKVLATDPSNDIAVIKIAATGLPTLPLGDSDAVQLGQSVIAIGNALGEYRNTVTQGIISGVSRTITAGDTGGQTETLEDVFQTDAAINPGNSGGPLVDLTGHVIGMNTAVNQSGQLIGFAIPINSIKRDVDSVNTSGSIVKPFLGVRYVILTPALAQQDKLSIDHGALLQADSNTNDPAIVAGSPADKAGLVAGDVIVSVNGVEIDTDHSLAGLLNKYTVGDTITLKVVHQGKTKSVLIKLEKRQT